MWKGFFFLSIIAHELTQQLHSSIIPPIYNLNVEREKRFLEGTRNMNNVESENV